MFAYCLNNPVCMADYEGEDAIYVVDFTRGPGFPIVGHAILFIQDQTGNWYRTDLQGTFPDKSTATVVIESTTSDQIQDFLKKGSRRSVHIEGDFSSSYELAKEYDGTNYGGYDAVANNCLHYVKELLRAGTPENAADHKSINSFGIIPALFYSTLINNRVHAFNSQFTRILLKGGHHVY